MARAKTINHIEYAIVPEGNSAIYQWQKYWGRKPHNVVNEFIENYCPPNGVVMDPFVGSGVTAIEALRSGRRAVVCDLNPMSRDILIATVCPPELNEFKLQSKLFMTNFGAKIQSLYAHKCMHCDCNVEILASSILVEKNIYPNEFRYKCACTQDLIREKSNKKDYFENFTKRLATEGVWWPDVELAYPNGEPFKERQKYVEYKDLFTPRNLLALAYIWDAIQNTEMDSKQRILFSTLFRSVVHLGSRVSADRRVRPLSTGWTQHSFWYAKNPVEINLWGAFTRKLAEYENVIADWSAIRKAPVRIAKTQNEVFLGKADLFIAVQDCSSFLRAMSQSAHKADYVFTDPPYNGMIQYGELSFMWNAWRTDIDAKEYLNRIETSELTENKSQNKKLPDYYQHLRAAFANITDAVKPSAYIHVTYSSPKVKYRNLSLRAARLAGLEFEKLHFQQSVRVSKKALEQPFGSIFGDFIFRFRKPTNQKQVSTTSRKVSFNGVIDERAIYMLKHRGEATPMSIIIAECEKELFKAGFFDDDDVLQKDVEKHVRNSASLKVDKRSFVSFTDKNEYDGTPLSLRVEKTVKEMLTAQRVVTYTDAWSGVLREYPNSLTPDSVSITTALKKFANPQKGGLWEAKAAVMRGKSTVHNRAILHCAKGALKKNFKFCIGKPEQSDGIFQAILKKSSSLNGLLDDKKNQHLISKQDLKRLANTDLIVWDDSGGLFTTAFCIEVETTTNFIDAFERFEPLSRVGSINASLVLLVGSRVEELQNKLRSKMTFQLIPEALKKVTKIVPFDNQSLETFENWASFQQKIKTAITWWDLEKKSKGA